MKCRFEYVCYIPSMWTVAFTCAVNLPIKPNPDNQEESAREHRHRIFTSKTEAEEFIDWLENN